MKSKSEEDQDSDEAAAQNTEVAPAVETVSDEDSSSELNESRWSVISFEKCEASSLTYDEAARKLKKLSKAGLSGLCIVADEVSERI